MESVYQFSPVEMLAFALVLVRVSSFIVSWPIFGTEGVSAPIKILFSLTVSIMLFPTMQWKSLQVDLNSESIIWMAVREVFVGLSLGYLARLFFFAVRIAGEIISVSMGFAGAQLFNPSMGEQSTALDQFYWGLAGLFFLAIDGHHLLLSGLADSFRVVPMGMSTLSVQAFKDMGRIVQDIMAIGLKMSAPVLTAVLFMNITMAVVGRAVPQINVLVTSLPVNILVGLIVMIVGIPLLIAQMDGLLESTTSQLFAVLKSY